MTFPEISVIMAIYNGEKYLRIAINSVLQQSFSEFEFIIVDDCSTDSTQAIINSYNEKRIVYIRNNQNLGQTPSLNIGLNIAKGKYIARIDADDIYLRGKLKLQYAFMEEHPNIAVCGTMSECVDENGDIYSNRSFPERPNDIYFRIFYQSPINHVSVIMRKSTIISVGSYDENYPICADFALWSKLIKNNHKLTNLPETLTQFRIHVRSLSVVNKMGKSGEETVDIIYNNIKDLLNIEISKFECKSIVLMFWPSSNLSIIDLTNAYLNLIVIAKKVYNNNIPKNVLRNLKKMYLKSLVKRGVYFKSKKKLRFFLKELSNILITYHIKNGIFMLSIISFSIVLFINEKNLKRMKLKFSL
jgi:glycosyltransferase involved in cell wall biosynthesis